MSSNGLACGEKCSGCGAAQQYRVNTRCHKCGLVFTDEMLAEKEAATRSLVEAVRRIIISTGDLKEPYEVIDAVFALDANDATWVSGADPSKAFDGVKSRLRSICHNLGGDAVVNCLFQYRSALADGGLFGKRQAIEILAYGTAVKFRRDVT